MVLQSRRIVMSTSHSFELAQIVIPAAVSLVVVALSHLFTSHRDREARRRDQRVDYLVSVFRALSRANHHPRLYEVADDLERAIADVQLFGTPEQVRLIQKFAIDLGTEKHAEMDALLNELRDSLRRELGRKPVAGNMRWLHIGRPEDLIANDTLRGTTNVGTAIAEGSGPSPRTK